MGMSLYVYVGPYIEVTGIPRNDILELLEEFEHLVTEGRGEAGVKDDTVYVIPNTPVEGITRQCTFERTDETPVVPLDRHKVHSETFAFHEHCYPFVDSLRPKTYKIKWGIVPCWR